MQYNYVHKYFNRYDVSLNFQNDMIKSLMSTKPTVNAQDLQKLENFKTDFGQEG